MDTRPLNPFNFDPGIFDTYAALTKLGLQKSFQDAEIFHDQYVKPKMESIKARVRAFWPDIPAMDSATNQAIMDIIKQSHEPVQMSLFSS